VLWTHNDSGNAPQLFAIDLKGKLLSQWTVTGARAVDWEDIAIGPGGLYVGDIGDNRLRRTFVTVYRLKEPNPRSDGGPTAAAEALRFRYPDGPHDAEAMMVHPRTGDLYIVTKANLSDGDTLVFRAAAPLRAKSGRVQTLEKVAVLNLGRGLLGRFAGVTGGDISPEGSRVVLCDYWGAWEARFDASWTGLEWVYVDVGARPQGEGICYRADGKALIVTSEGEMFPLVETQQKE
jgi:hypothetical protein